MPGTDIASAVIFDGPRTAGAWGAVLRGCARPVVDPRPLPIRVREYLASHPMSTVRDIAGGLGYPHPHGYLQVLPCLEEMARHGQARRHKGAWAAGDRRTTVRWEAA